MAREVATPVEKEAEGRQRHGVVSFLRELPVLVGLALGIALLIKAFLVQAFFIPSPSMVPTLQIGDRVLVNKLTYRFHPPRRGDVIVFRDPWQEVRCPPGQASANPECNKSAARRAYEWFAELFGLPTGETKDYIKRVVGLPGETIEMRDGDIYINGKLVTFPSSPTEGPQKDHYTMPPQQIPKDHYWVMGDNRAQSQDSRVFGPIPRSKIVGKAFVLLWPPNRFNGL